MSCCLVTACGDSTTQVQPPPEVDMSLATLEIASGADQEGVVGAAAPEPLVVTVRDVEGATVAGAPVWWTFTHGRGVPNGAAAGTTVRTLTDQSGRASIEWELGFRAGLQTALASLDAPAPAPVSGLAPKQDNPNRKGGFRANAKPARPAEILLSVDTLVLEVGEQVTVTATVVDRYGNVIPDAVVEWQSSDSSVATVTPVVPAPVPVPRISEQQ